MKVKIVPTILTQNFAEFKERLKMVEPFFNLVQIDCGDGRFVANKTFYAVNKVKSIKYKGGFELHLMVKDPLREIKKWVKNKKVKNVFFHFEAVKNDKKILEIIKSLHQNGIKAGLAINPETKVAKVTKFLDQIDILMFLGVNPGWGGRKFQIKVLNKIKQIRKAWPKLDIEVDGGVNLKNASQIVKAGANILAVGKSLDSKENLIKFKTI
jgi:ribulose-phosphate 3-epimerase